MSMSEEQKETQESKINQLLKIVNGNIQLVKAYLQETNAINDLESKLDVVSIDYLITEYTKLNDYLSAGRLEK